MNSYSFIQDGWLIRVFVSPRAIDIIMTGHDDIRTVHLDREKLGL